MIEFKINKLSDIEGVALRFLKKFTNPTIFAFYGEMGSGKTTFIKELCKQLGTIDNITSPTFSIVNHYKTKFKGDIYHFDFYRIESKEEAFDLGYEEYFYDKNYCFIEWPELIEELLPENCIKVYIIEENDETRTLKF